MGCLIRLALLSVIQFHQHFYRFSLHQASYALMLCFAQSIILSKTPVDSERTESVSTSVALQPGQSAVVG